MLLLACASLVLLPSSPTVLRRLLPRSSRAQGRGGCNSAACPIAMQVRMPEDEATIDALIDQTRQTTSVVVLYFADPSAFAEPEWSSSWGDASEPTARDDIVNRVATE